MASMFCVNDILVAGFTVLTGLNAGVLLHRNFARLRVCRLNGIDTRHRTNFNISLTAEHNIKRRLYFLFNIVDSSGVIAK
jgi:hypothetical protein